MKPSQRIERWHASPRDSRWATGVSLKKYKKGRLGGLNLIQLPFLCIFFFVLLGGCIDCSKQILVTLVKRILPSLPTFTGLTTSNHLHWYHPLAQSSSIVSWACKTQPHAQRYLSANLFSFLYPLSPIHPFLQPNMSTQFVQPYSLPMPISSKGRERDYSSSAYSISPPEVDESISSGTGPSYSQPSGYSVANSSYAGSQSGDFDSTVSASGIDLNEYMHDRFAQSFDPTPLDRNIAIQAQTWVFFIPRILFSLPAGSNTTS